ncbi:MAG: SAM-dependent methyltransferase, partial [Chloroflexi bacterium]
MHTAEHVVDVHYDMTIENKITGNYERVSEYHRMRYFTTDELDRSLRKVGLKLIQSEEWPNA